MIHYGMNQKEQQRRRNSTGAYEPAALCGNGDGNAELTREGGKVDCPSCKAILKRDPAFLNPEKMTRQEYMQPGGGVEAGRERHRRYFGEIAEECNAGRLISSELVSRCAIALARGDRALNTIPLGLWDSMVHRLSGASQSLKDRGDWLSLGTGVCVLKEAARRKAKTAPPDFIALADRQIEAVSRVAQDVAKALGKTYGEAESAKWRESFLAEVAAQLERNFHAS
jgi:hypothetical protein